MHPCAAHDTHNSFRWAMHGEFNDRQLLRDCYVAIEALQKSMDMLVYFDTHVMPLSPQICNDGDQVPGHSCFHTSEDWTLLVWPLWISEG